MKNILAFILLAVGISYSSQTFAQESEEEIFVFVEVEATFLGGDAARLNFLSENIKYPAKAMSKGIQGIVYASFVVEKDGRITNIKILRGIGGGCDEEVIRVLKKMPRWKPGTQRGQAVRTQFNMPIKFTLADETEEKSE